MKQISTILNELEQSWQAIVRELRIKIVSAMNPGQNPAAPPVRTVVVGWPGQNRRRNPRKPERFKIVKAVGDVRGRIYLLVEQPAQLRRTKWNVNGRCADYVVSLPYMLFIVRLYRGAFEEILSFFLDGPYRGEDTPLYHTVLPNTFESGSVCIGNSVSHDQLTRETVRLDSAVAKADAVLDWFWNRTHFTNHMMERLIVAGASLHTALASPAAWEGASRRNPGFIRSITWDFAGTVSDFLKRED